MSAPVRFLAVAVVGWVAVRGRRRWARCRASRSARRARDAVADRADRIVAVRRRALAAGAKAARSRRSKPLRRRCIAPALSADRHVPARYYRRRPCARRRRSSPPRPSRRGRRGAWRTIGYSLLPPLADRRRCRRKAPPAAASVTPAVRKLDRWQLASWALLRGAPTPGTLASGGTLGGSQAGARLLYLFNRSLAASVRTTSPIGGSSGAEIAAGVRWAPLRSLPVAFTVERRQSISRLRRPLRLRDVRRGRAVPPAAALALRARRLSAGRRRRPARARPVRRRRARLHPPGLSARSPPASARGAATSRASTASTPGRG